MKELAKILLKDFQGECFTTFDYVVFGVLVPCALVGCMLVEGWVESLCK